MKDWIKELFYVKVTNGKTYWEKSATKLFLTLIRIGFLVILVLVITAFATRLFDPSREDLDVGILGAFSGLGLILSILLGFLQNNYSTHKKIVMQNVMSKGVLDEEQDY